MITEYQKQKLNELVSWLWDFQDTRHHDMEDAIKLAEEIRDYPMLTAQNEETNDESIIMNAYLHGSRLELFQSVRFNIPWVCLSGDEYIGIGMALDRFVELLGVRKSQQRERGK